MLGDHEAEDVGLPSFPEDEALIREWDLEADKGREHHYHYAIRIGEVLARLRPMFAHGQWERWVEERCGLSVDKAKRYRRCLRHRYRIEEKLKGARVLPQDLSQREALRLAQEDGHKPSSHGSIRASDEERVIKMLRRIFRRHPDDLSPEERGELGELFANGIAWLNGTPDQPVPPTPGVEPAPTTPGNGHAPGLTSITITAASAEDLAKKMRGLNIGRRRRGPKPPRERPGQRLLNPERALVAPL